MEKTSNKVSLAEYLLRRLAELGIDEVFGVPGDYNLAFLDHVLRFDGLHWVGNCNELNAAYAADGYARVKGSAALVTTFGVGELSAINGVAGSFAEYLPVVNIVGWPATTAQHHKMLMHHTLGTGDFDVFREMFEKISAAVVVLDSPEDAAEQLDHALELGWIKKQPVYIGLPSDCVNLEIDPPENKLHLAYPTSNSSAVQEVASRAVVVLQQAKSPVVLLDLCTLRHPMKALIQAFLEQTGLPFATMSMAKGIFDESNPNFLGIYNGDYSTSGVQARVEQSDCIVAFGYMLSDFNTGGFTCNLDADASIEIHSSHAKLKQAMYPDVYFDAMIPALIKAVEGYTYQEQITLPQVLSYTPSTKRLTQQRLWHRMAHYFKAQDIILAETGTSMFALLDVPIVHEVTVIMQPLWASIGYAVGALLGAALAAPERRAILFVGDGSFQLTAQALSTMIKHKLNPIIFLLNNDGYTIERAIHGKNMAYNDIQSWNYTELPRAFGGDAFTAIVETENALEQALMDTEHHKDKLCFIELKLEQDDCPEILQKLGAACDAKNKGD